MGHKIEAIQRLRRCEDESRGSARLLIGIQDTKPFELSVYS